MLFFRFYFVNNREIYNLSKEYIRFCIYSFCYIDVFLKENLCDFSTCRTKSGLLQWLSQTESLFRDAKSAAQISEPGDEISVLQRNLQFV